MPSPAIPVCCGKQNQEATLDKRELMLYIVVPFNVILILIIYYWWF